MNLLGPLVSHLVGGKDAGLNGKKFGFTRAVLFFGHFRLQVAGESSSDNMQLEKYCGREKSLNLLSFEHDMLCQNMIFPLAGCSSTSPFYCVIPVLFSFVHEPKFMRLSMMRVDSVDDSAIAERTIDTVLLLLKCTLMLQYVQSSRKSA